jgi:hypothetical protein
MTRRLATWAIVAIAALGLSACSGSPSAPTSPTENPATTASAAPETTPAAPETAPAEQSLAEACVEPTKKLMEASERLTEISNRLTEANGEDPQAMVDALAELADYFGTVAESTTHPELKKALSGIEESYRKFSEIVAKVLIDKDTSAASDVMTVMNDLQESATAFQKLCGA